VPGTRPRGPGLVPAVVLPRGTPLHLDTFATRWTATFTFTSERLRPSF
jgi:hypothetical protein